MLPGCLFSSKNSETEPGDILLQRGGHMQEPAQGGKSLRPREGTHTQWKEALLSLESQNKLELGRCLPPERLQVLIVELRVFPSHSVS